MIKKYRNPISDSLQKSGKARGLIERTWDKQTDDINAAALKEGAGKQRFAPLSWALIFSLSAIVTLSLMWSMSRMIAAEFQVQDKLSDTSFEINPVEKLIVKIKPVSAPEPFQKVDVPPPPPQTGFDPTDKVKVPPVNLGDRKPSFKPRTDFRPELPAIAVEKDYSPIQRVAPIMPPRATRSGHCMMRFDVSVDGLPFNVEAVACSDPLFARPSIKAVQRWKYLPRLQDGRAVAVNDVRTRIAFNLMDEAGQLIAARE